MNQKTVIITGANSGIGKAAARKFAGEGHTVIMACRNLEKSRPVRDQIATKTGNGRVLLEQVDMSSFESIRDFCSTYQEKHQKLDILIHNAAYFNHGSPYKQSPDGIEITFATNVAGPFLMTMLLRDLLAASDDARILHAGSNIIKHFLNPKKEIDFDHLQKEPENPRNHSVYINYRNSKMALLMLSFRMAKEFAGDGIKTYSLQINGATMSKEALMKVKPHWRIIARIQNLFFRPPEFTANLYYEICISEKFREMSGVHFNHKLDVMQPAKTDAGIITDIKQGAGADVYPAYAMNEEASEKVWNVCNELTQEHSKLII
ncbi:SDR family NAD(P)-dependent oxidoreductase [Rhodohalobacter sp. SW132]|uniref:SDR family NAD(P)-dependent oxidoreductase n=1 Tax=Rhodohalobacter sp. SW132 TaxID=2293433 RepID=UPI000E22BB78|nr:SDR family NAD(P)-dependent oxidoreductase [Rhodohalobacter sp. SW132]REL37736.1 SDR family NAD(P)-dependent oxidoreductase [Rhodohalobacter sp. SW132]